MNSAACIWECKNVDMSGGGVSVEISGDGGMNRQISLQTCIDLTMSVTIDYFLSFNAGKGNAYGQKS